MTTFASLAPLLGFLLLHFVVGTIFFQIVQRPLFWFYNRKVRHLAPTDLQQTAWHGLYTDIKVGLYLTIVPVLLVWAHCHGLVANTGPWIIAYDILVALPVALLCVADAVLYNYWQYKIEASVLHYLRSLKGAFASVSALFVAMGLMGVGVVATVLALALIAAYLPFGTLLNTPLLPTATTHIFVALAGLLLVAIFFVAIRGLHRRPDTPVYSYYCNVAFLNHCAVNPVYNFIYSLSITDDFSHQFQAFPEDYCQERFSQLIPTQGTPQIQLLNTPRPNIVVVMWESLCAHFIEAMGGKPDVMPRFSQLTKEGVFFSNCWAGSFRTDRGLVCIFSGYPSPPTTSIILHTAKLPHLPALPRLLRDTEGYRTTAVHGGDLKIFHKNDYYWASGHDRHVEQKHFPKDTPAEKWGIHDGIMFEWLVQDIIAQQAAGQRFFTTFQTLSTHEPFKVPYERIPHNDIDNAYAYADEAFGRFVDQLKASPAWKDLLLIVTGDHGLDINRVPDKDRNSHIPLLMLGGALRQPMTIDTLMSQTDIAATLLGQMGIEHNDFIFSRDVLADTYRYPFALHTYVNAFIYRDHTGVTHYDTLAQQPTDGHDAQREENAKVILQTLYSDLGRR